MKHSDWLRLNQECEQICAVFRQQGYQCKKQTRRLSWQFGKEGQDVNKQRLPECCAIYFAIAREQVLYVGQATNLRNRWQNHHRLPQLEIDSDTNGT